MCCSSGIPRIDIALSTNADDTHLRYQSHVYFGVADLKILVEFFNSSVVKLLDCFFAFSLRFSNLFFKFFFKIFPLLMCFEITYLLLLWLCHNYFLVSLKSEVTTMIGKERVNPTISTLRDFKGESYSHPIYNCYELSLRTVICLVSCENNTHW